MSTDRGIKLALSLSLSWHIICVQAFSLTFPSPALEKKEFTAISFLGQFLDRNLLSWREGLSRRPLVVTDDGQPLKNVLVSDISLDEADLGDIRTALFRKEIVIEKQPLLPSQVASKGPLLTEPVTLPTGFGSRDIQKRQKPVQIEEPLELRGVVFRPGAFRGFGDIDQQGKTIVLKFLVSPEGRVLFVEKGSSCGDSDIDSSYIRYIKRWYFTPLEMSLPQTEKKFLTGFTPIETESAQWSQAKFNFPISE